MKIGNRIKHILQKIPFGGGRILAAVFSVLLVLFFVMALGIQIFSMWLNSESGSRWINGQIDSALRESGYNVELSGFNFAWPLGIGVDRLEVRGAKTNNMIGHSEGVKISVGLVAPIIRQAVIYARIDKLSIDYIPEKQEQKDQEEKIYVPIAMPDIFFKKTYLDLKIDQIILSEEIIEGGYAGSLSYKQALKIDGDHIKGQGEIELGLPQVSYKSFLPDKILFDLDADLKAGVVDISSLIASSEAVFMEASGEYHLADQYMALDVTSKLDRPDLYLDEMLVDPVVLSLVIKGTPEKAAGHFDLGTHIEGKVFEVNSPIDLTSQNVTFTKIEGSLMGNSLSGQVRASLDNSAVNGQVALSFKDLAFINQFVPDLDLGGQGTIAAEFSQSGDAAQSIKVSGDFKNISYEGEHLSDLSFRVMQKNNIPHLSFSASNKEQHDFNLSGDLSLTDIAQRSVEIEKLELRTGQGYVRVTGHIKPEAIGIDFSAQDFDLSRVPFAGLAEVPLVLSKASGKISGGFAAPIFDFDGDWQMSGQGATRAVVTSKVKYNGQTLRADVSGDGQGIKSLSGYAELAAKISLDPYVFESENAHGAVKADLDLGPLLRHVPMNSFGVAGRVTLDLVFATYGGQDDGRYLLSGDILPEKILIDLPSRFNSDIPRLNVVTKDEPQQPSFIKEVLLDLDFNAPNQIFVRGWGLDTELGGVLDIGGSLDVPDINGSLSSLRGRYEEFGKKFDLERAVLTFQGSVPPSPYLDIVASNDAGDVTAKILIGGNAAKPSIKLSSVPELPQDEILSRILFGTSSAKISPFQAVQLAQALQRFSGNSTGPALFDPIGTLRKATGLDDISVEGVGTKDAKVSAGKYITDKVYVDVKRGASENSGSASVRVKVSPQVSVESSAGENGSAGGSVFWEWEY
ncbi:MAG: translocation/assembly module TamB domain-containing protein [Alphaproteobacteria bacterium]|nr:translocation/assembly module TamB domain-containing protein [Alphaproteobacteria bacterium]